MMDRMIGGSVMRALAYQTKSQASLAPLKQLHSSPRRWEENRQSQQTSSSSSSSSSSTQATSSSSNASKMESQPQSLQEEQSAGSSNSAPPPFTTPSSVVYAEQDKKPLPFLSQPLGVKERPNSRKLTWAERRERALDYDRRLEKRKAIVKEATRGYFHDFHAMQSHGGKTWRAPTTLIRQDRALYFPDIIGTPLASSSSSSKVHTADLLQDKVSLVCIMTSQVSEQHSKSFYEPALDVYGKEGKNFQLIQINSQENSIKNFLVSLFLSSLRKTVDPALHPTYLLSNQNLELEREQLGLHNKHVGYTYLVGPDLKIRWAGGGFAEKEEREALIACAGVLLNRLKEQKRASRR